MPRAEERLPEPDVSGVIRWWNGNRARFDPGVRYLGGQPTSLQRLAGALAGGPMRRRAPIAFELAVRTRGRLQIETRAFLGEQRRRLASVRRHVRWDIRWSMLQLNNQSRFAPLVQVLPDRDAVDTLYVVVRGTFTLAPVPELGAAQPPPHAADVYWGEPGASSLKYAADIHVGKVGTDVALVGSAHAPRGRAVTEMLAAVSVAGRRKVVRVVGDRTWRGRHRWRDVAGAVREHAAGLRARVRRARSSRARRRGRTDGRWVAAEERNPVGVGFCAVRRLRWGAGVRLPNLEDPQRPWRTLGDRPPPAGFGFVAPSWQPRRGYAGTYDEAWAAKRAPFLPRDFDPRFGNAASAGLTFDDGLRGGEPIALDGVSREGAAAIGGARDPAARRGRHRRWPREAPPVRLETLLLEPDEQRMSLTWRAALRCDKRALKIERIHIREEAAPSCRARSS